ncbi:MAG: heme lyase CcmF/NrfE family subunit [Terriglobia bacterium]
MADLGYYSLLAAFVLAFYAMAACLAGGWRRRWELVASGERALLAHAGFLILSSAALLHALVTRNFELEYVASHTDSHLPTFYTVSAFWAGQQGSLLFWSLALALFVSLVILQNRHKNRSLMPQACTVLAGVSLFFLSLLIFAANPFEKLPAPPAEGGGLNPLLQNPGMIFHPPALLLGYVAFTIPFAFAIAALWTKRLDSTWIRTTRRWTLFAWFTLGLGVLLGAEWAYKVLGWGGYWGWDPVENASLMPWLVGTAYLHSVMIQEKKGMLKVWNLVLIILTFELAIFGTFITRSGILSSVHSFGQSTLGPFFLTFLTTSFGFSLWLLWTRRAHLRSANQLESLLSRESSFLFNNLILVGIALAVFWGTIFPVISEAVRGQKISVGPPFFNKVTIPFALVLLLLTGFCPLIAWRKASWKNFRRNFVWPLLTSLLVAAGLLVGGVHSKLAVAFFAVGAFVLTVTLLEFARGARTRQKMSSENYAFALYKLTAKNKRRYGGFVIHIGIVLLFAGITGSSLFQTEAQASLAPGESVEVGSYTLIFQGLRSQRSPSKDSVSAQLDIYKKDRYIGVLSPAKHFHRNAKQPMTAVGIRSTLLDDLYVILAGWDESGRATFKVLINPLIAWIWSGGLIMLLGTVVVMWPDRQSLPVAEAVAKKVAYDVA